MKNKYAVLFFVTFTLLSLSAAFNYKLIRINGELRKLIPVERIEYFNLFSAEDEPVSIDAAELKGNKPSLIFFLSRPCSVCDQNLLMMNRIADTMKDKVKVFGVILDTYEQAREFVQKKKTYFKIYVPDDLYRFEKEMHFFSNQTMTMIYHEGMVKFRKIGNISGEDYTRVFRILKKISK